MTFLFIIYYLLWAQITQPSAVFLGRKIFHAQMKNQSKKIPYIGCFVVLFSFLTTYQDIFELLFYSRNFIVELGISVNTYLIKNTIQTGINAIVQAIYRIDSLSVVKDSFPTFIALMYTTRSTRESVKYFESRFDAQVWKFNAKSVTSQLPESITAFMLLGKEAV